MTWWERHILDFMDNLTLEEKQYFHALASNIVLQQRSAMPENMRTATLNQEVIRRMVQTSENLYVSTRLEVLDNFVRKVINSEYGRKQTRNIMVGGLMGYEWKMKLSRDVTNQKWQPLHPPARFNITTSRKNMILGKNNWFKRTSSQEEMTSSQQEDPSNPLEGEAGHEEENEVKRVLIQR